MSKNFVGIDLGSSNIAIYIPERGIVFNEPNIVSIIKEKKKKEVVSFGYLALKKLGKEEEGVKVVRPVKDGLVQSVEDLTLLLKAIFKSVKALNVVDNSYLVFSSRSATNEVNNEALKQVAKNLSARGIYIRAQSQLAAISASNGVSPSKGSLVVTLGGGISDISVLSGDEVLLSRSCEFSGRRIDEAIIRHIRKNHHLIIGEKTAEYIKMKIGSIEQFPENRLLEVSGKNILTGLPHSIVVSTLEIKQLIVGPMTSLVDAIQDCLELTPPEIASDIIDQGMVICGGMALLDGMREYLESSLNLSVRLAPEPTYTVVNGIKNLIHSELSK